MDANRASCGCFDVFARSLFQRQDLTHEARITLLSIETRIQQTVGLQLVDERNMQTAREEYAEATKYHDELACTRLEAEHESYYEAWVRHQQCVVVLRTALKRLETVQSTVDQFEVVQKTNAVTSAMMSAKTAEEVNAAVLQFEMDGIFLDDVGKQLEKVSKSSASQRSIHSLLPKDPAHSRGRQSKGRQVDEDEEPLIAPAANPKQATKKPKHTRGPNNAAPADSDML